MDAKGSKRIRDSREEGVNKCTIPGSWRQTQEGHRAVDIVVIVKKKPSASGKSKIQEPCAGEYIDS